MAPRISKLLNTYEEEEYAGASSLSRKEYKERVKHNIIIIGWNAYIDNLGIGNYPYESGTRYAAWFKRGWREAEMFDKGEESGFPSYKESVLNKRTPAAKRSIKQCKNMLKE